MKHFAAAVLLLTFIISTSVHAQPSSEKKTIEELVNTLTRAYASKTLGSLDAGKPYLGNVTVVIEHSLGDKSETKRFRSFGKVEDWLKSRETEELPARQTNALKQCRKGVCRYDSGNGLSHNQLYLV